MALAGFYFGLRQRLFKKLIPSCANAPAGCWLRETFDWLATVAAR